MSRSTTDTDLIDYLPWDNQTIMEFEPFFTEYLGSLAFLNEKFSALGSSSLHLYHQLAKRSVSHRPRPLTKAEKMGFWFLGPSYNYTLRIDPKRDLKCGAHSCYEKTLKSGKICKPGLSFCYVIQYIIESEMIVIKLKKYK